MPVNCGVILYSVKIPPGMSPIDRLPFHVTFLFLSYINLLIIMSDHMDKIYIEDKIFDKTDFSQEPLQQATYENCSFVNCELSNADLSGMDFIECTFNGCNLSTAKLNNTAFRDVTFKDCKLMGLQFANCDHFLFTVTFDNCILKFSSFYKMKLKKLSFIKCNLVEVDFTEANLSASCFDHCDLAKALFDNTVLEKADLRTAFNYSIDPERNKIKKAKFSMTGIAGLLDKYDIEIDVAS